MSPWLMGMLENARANLGAGKESNDDRLIAVAGVQASIAIAESLDEVHTLLGVLIDKADQIDSAVMLIVNNVDT